MREVGKGSGTLPASFSLLDCKTAGVIVETIKRAEDGEGIVVRMYEAYKERKTARLAIPYATEVSLCDLNEKEVSKLPLEGGMVAITIKPFEIITLKIKTK